MQDVINCFKYTSNVLFKILAHSNETSPRPCAAAICSIRFLSISLSNNPPLSK
ncbi:hypothetical protein LguiB_012328 [Lonicera macranthoides]